MDRKRHFSIHVSGLCPKNGKHWT